MTPHRAQNSLPLSHSANRTCKKPDTPMITWVYLPLFCHTGAYFEAERYRCYATYIPKNKFLAVNPDGAHFEFLEQGLHKAPAKMKPAIQEKIDEAKQDFDYIVLGYGLCGNGTLGIRAREIPVVIPRAHDCITYWLGSRERHLQEHSKAPASYYLTKGWIEEAKAPLATFDEYKERYGLKTAEWVIREEFKNYTRPALITTGAYDPAQYRQYAQSNAAFLGVNYEEITGSLALFEKMIRNEWEDNGFIILQPGEEITQMMFLSLE